MSPVDDLHSKKRPHAQKKVIRPTALGRKGNHHDRVTPKPPISRSSSDLSEAWDEEAPMASSFQQFCSTCDKQIIVPNASILYCSERCRRQDSQAQSLPLFKTDLSPPPSPYASTNFDASSMRDSASQPSPANYIAVPSTPMSSYHFVSETPSFQLIADGKVRRPSAPRTDSEAARYLAQFGAPSETITTRPRGIRPSEAPTGDSTPSLSHTSSFPSGPTTPYTPQHNSLSSSSHRPPTRMPNPRWSSTSFSSRTIDLVTPVSYIASFTPVTSDVPLPRIKSESRNPHAIDFIDHRKGEVMGAAEESLSYEKKFRLENIPASPGRGSLKQLFRFKEMRAQPLVAEVALVDSTIDVGAISMKQNL